MVDLIQVEIPPTKLGGYTPLFELCPPKESLVTIRACYCSCDLRNLFYVAVAVQFAGGMCAPHLARAGFEVASQCWSLGIDPERVDFVDPLARGTPTALSGGLRSRNEFRPTCDARLQSLLSGNIVSPDATTRISTFPGMSGSSPFDGRALCGESKFSWGACLKGRGIRHWHGR